jgi:HAD superfamily hydrolase (TIGR01509 family)
MTKSWSFIFDLDGTLYGFDKNQTTTFLQSRFYGEIQQRVCKLLIEKCGVAADNVVDHYQQLKARYQDQVSLAVEKEYGIDRRDYFSEVWNVSPAEYIDENERLLAVLQPVANRSALLTQAPAVWARRVLAHLRVQSIFGEKIFTGEPTLRKPDPAIFRAAAAALGVDPEQVVSIGDQVETDILPAKKVGMKTLLISSEANDVADWVAPNIEEAMQLLKKEGLI